MTLLGEEISTVGMAMWKLLRVWLPTALGASMLVAEIPAVYAAAGRSDDGAQVLAALGICVSILVVVNTPALAITPLVVVEEGRQPAGRLLRYAFGVGLAGSLILLALATSPLADLLQAGFGIDEALAGHVRAGLLGMVPNSLAVALRRYLHGRFIQTGRTRPIALATVLRIAGTSLLAFGAVALFPQNGALAGGLALSAGAFSEAAWLTLGVRRLAHPRAGTVQRRIGTLVRHHADLSVARLLNMVPMLVTTVGVAHSARAPQSLVAWPALYELAALFSAPTQDWDSVVAAALRRDRADHTPRRLTVWLCGAFVGAFAAVLLIPGLGTAYMSGLLAVPPQPTELGLRWAPLLLVVPALWLIRADLRGALIADEATGWLVRAGAAHTAILALATAALAMTNAPGVAVGCVAILAGLLADLAVTARGNTESREPGAVPTGRMTTGPEAGCR